MLSICPQLCYRTCLEVGSEARMRVGVSLGPPDIFTDFISSWLILTKFTLLLVFLRPRDVIKPPALLSVFEPRGGSTPDEAQGVRVKFCSPDLFLQMIHSYADLAHPPEHWPWSHGSWDACWLLCMLIVMLFKTNWLHAPYIICQEMENCSYILNWSRGVVKIVTCRSGNRL